MEEDLYSPINKKKDAVEFLCECWERMDGGEESLVRSA